MTKTAKYNLLKDFACRAYHGMFEDNAPYEEGWEAFYNYKNSLLNQGKITEGEWNEFLFPFNEGEALSMTAVKAVLEELAE